MTPKEAGPKSHVPVKVESLAAALREVLGGNLDVSVPRSFNNDPIDVLGSLIQGTVDTWRAERSRSVQAQHDEQERIEELLNVVTGLTHLDFSVRANEGTRTDACDSLGYAVNCLAEELGAATVSRDYLNNILESMNDGLIVLTSQGVIQSVNRAIRELLDYENAELEGQPLEKVLELKGRRDAPNLKTLLGSRVSDFATVLLTKAGTPVPVSVNTATMEEGTQDLTGAVCVVRDMRETERLVEKAEAAAYTEKLKSEQLKVALSELKRTHAELLRAQAQLVQAGKLSAVGELAGGVAHEINNPLQAVLGNSQFLMEDAQKVAELPAELEGLPKFVDRIRESAKRCQTVVQGLLAFSRASSTDRPVEFDLSIAVDKALELIATKVRHQNTTLRAQLPPGVMCFGNANQLQQVVINLVLNAAQALVQDGEIGVVVKSMGTWVELTVSDTGPGIPAETRSRIFEPFFTTKGIGEGTGLGLSVSYGIIQAHRGTLAVECPPEGGSVFQAILPVDEAELPPEALVESTGDSSGSGVLGAK